MIEIQNRVNLRDIGKIATVVVAASNSEQKCKADYICDGINDEAEIGAALGSYKQVYLLEGTFHIGSQLVIPLGHILTGGGIGTILKREYTDTFTAFIEINGSSTLKNVELDGNKSSYGGDGVILGDKSTLEDCIVKNISYYSVIGWGDGFGIFNNIINDAGTFGYGICVSGSSWVCNGVISGNRVSNCPLGMKIKYAERCSITGNNIWGGETGLRLYHSDKPTRYNIISGNIINGSYSGVQIDADIAPYLGMSKGDRIANNIIYGGTNGIISNSLKTSITGNVIAGGSFAAIVSRGKENMIDGNILIDTGIILRYSDDSIVRNNWIEGGCYYSEANGAGIFVGGTNERNIIIGNHLLNCRGSGIRIRNTFGTNYDTLLKDNVIVNSWGIYEESGSVRTILSTPSFNLFMDILGISAVQIRSNEDLSVALPITFTLDDQPDVPRTLSGHFDTHVNVTEYDIEITGISGKGIEIIEAKDETDGWDWETNNAFGTVSSIKMTTRVGTGVGDTIDIGITDVLGLSGDICRTSDVYKIKKNNGNQSVSGLQMDHTYDTYDMSVIGLAATDDFTIWFKRNLNVIR